MKSFQTKMDVISNNIANVSTTGFKSGRVQFQDMLSQTISNAQGNTSGGLGGINSQQIGLGVRVGSIDNIMTDGHMQPTNRDLDFAVEGEGFFILSTDEEGNENDRVYTRDGAFFRESSGNLVNASGMRVIGYQEGTDNLIPLVIPEEDEDQNQLESYFIDGAGVITAKYEDVAEPVVIGQIALARFSNPEGLEKLGGNNFATTNNTGVTTEGRSGLNGFGNVRQGYLEMSNVDLANEFTEMIITSRAYSANARSITTSDEMLQELINLKR